MTGKDLFHATAQTDEKYISDSENVEEIKHSFQKAKTKKIKTALSVCGCVVFAAAAAFALHGVSTEPGLPEDPSSNGVTESISDKAQSEGNVKETTDPATVHDLLPSGTAEIYQVPHWEERSVIDRFAELSYNGAQYLVSGHETGDADFGEPIGTAVVTGFDMYTDTEHKEEVSVFAIRDVSAQCAVGVKFADGVCTVYHNYDYTPATLGQFLEDCGLKKYLVFGKAYANYFDADKKYHTVEFADFDDSAVWELLLCDAGAKNLPDTETRGDNLADISVSVPALGIENLGIWITGDGYLCTNLLATLKCFYIGAEKTKAFTDYLYANVPYTDEAPDFSAGDVGEPEIVTASEGATTEGFSGIAE